MKISGPVLADHLLPTGLPGGQGLNKECQALSADGPGGEFFLIFSYASSSTLYPCQ